MLYLRQIEDNTMQGNEYDLAALKALKHSAGGFAPHLEEVLRSLLTLPYDESLRAFLSVLFEYILVVDKDNKKNIEEKILSTGSKGSREAYMTIAEQLIEEGKIKGKIEGRTEGIREGKLADKQSVLLRLLQKKFGAAEESIVEKVMSAQEPDKLDRAIDSVLDAASIDDVLRHLD